MSETPNREDVINAWKPLSAQGFGDPAEIGEPITGKPRTQEMVDAEQLYSTWYSSEKAKHRTPEDELKFQFETTMLYVEAGFTGEVYLDEVANDWLVNDADAAEEQGFTELAAEINAKRDEINNKLGNT